MNTFSVSLPMPPALSALTNNVGRTRVPSKVYRVWKAAAAQIVMAAWKAQGSPRFEPHMQAIYHLGLNYRGDIANREKPITDLLVQTIPGFPDDRWIDRMEIERVPGLDGARILITQLAPPETRRSEVVPFGILAADVVRGIAARMDDAA